MSLLTKKIIVITTGGTIGSIAQSESVSIDITKTDVLEVINLAAKKLGHTIELMSPLNKNSENFSPVDWVDLLTCLKKANDSDADGIIVTHGTDTMVYSVAAAVAYHPCWDKKICFTGSYYPPTYPNSDALLNLLASLEFIASDYPYNGIYIGFRSNYSNTVARIIQGSHIKPMAFDDQVFNSTYGEIIATYDLKQGLSTSRCMPMSSPCLVETVFPCKDDLINVQDEIACISLYPGIDNYFLENVIKGRRILIIEMYHSGTGSTANELITLIQSHAKNTVILMGTFPQKYIELPYTSTKKFKNAGAYIYVNLPHHFLYVFALLSLSLGKSPNTIVDSLSSWELS